MIISTDRLSFFTELYDRAKALQRDSADNMEKWRGMYKGTYSSSGADYSMTRNITYELVESQVSTRIPTPEVNCLIHRKKDEYKAETVELMLKNLRSSLPFDRINDLDERYTYIFGGSVFLVEWNEGEKTGESSGKIRISGISPEDFIPQPGVCDIRDMEYCFITHSTPVQEVSRRWNIPNEKVLAASKPSDSGTVRVIICFYKNEKGYVSLYIFCDGLEIAFLDDYYARKRTFCKKCLGSKCTCTCKEPMYETVSSEFETLCEDITRSDGSVIKKGSVIPRYRPKNFPIVIRKNTSYGDGVLGQSDCEFIYPQQEEINKVLSRIHEKLIMSGVYPYKPEGCRFKFDNTVGGKVLNLSPADQPSSFGVIDTTPDIARDLEYVNSVYEDAKRILGISDTYMGINDSTAISGRAKEIQIKQASGRLDSKRAMKDAAYADIDRITFELMLAFSDDVSILRDNAESGSENKAPYVFTRYDFVEYDSSNSLYYYNDGFIFGAYRGSDEENAVRWKRNLESFKAGVFGSTDDISALYMYWHAQKRDGYPGAAENIAYLSGKTFERSETNG